MAFADRFMAVLRFDSLHFSFRDSLLTADIKLQGQYYINKKIKSAATYCRIEIYDVSTDNSVWLY
jgi:hypothetical protein